jgi:hypothetical protein
MRWLWLVIALAGCRQVFGIDEPLPGGGVATDARVDSRSNDAPPALMTGLAMYVESGVALWTNDQPPDVAWAQTNPALATKQVWTGDGPDVATLVFSGAIDPQTPFTVWMEGQVNLPQGQQQVQMSAADYGFFDLELTPNSGQFQQVVSSRNAMTQMKGISVQAAGWYRVRVGWASQPASASFKVLHQDLNDPSVVAFNVTDLRH